MKIVTDQPIRQYELTVLLPVYLTDAEQAEWQKELEALIKKHQGKLKDTQDWGKKRLAYKLKAAGKAYTEAVYYHYRVEFEPDKVVAFELDLYLKSKLLRHLLVKETEDKKPQLVVQAEVAA